MTKSSQYRIIFSRWVASVFIAIAIYGFSSIPSLGITSQLSPSHATSENNLIKMQLSENESAHSSIKQLVARQANAWETANVEKLLADFAEDSIFVVPGGVYRGKREIQEAAEGYFTQFTNTKVTIKRVISQENQGAIEWAWSEKNKKTGEQSQAEDAIIFELENGKIKYWREYIDKESQVN
jgi:uncharacterized protein (TIGR02246 family)